MQYLVETASAHLCTHPWRHCLNLLMHPSSHGSYNLHTSVGTLETQLPSEVDLLLQTLRVLYAVIPYLNVLSDRAPELMDLWRRFGYRMSQDGALDIQTLSTLKASLQGPCMHSLN
jgi:hypothetical protein